MTMRKLPLLLLLGGCLHRADTLPSEPAQWSGRVTQLEPLWSDSVNTDTSALAFVILGGLNEGRRFTVDSRTRITSSLDTALRIDTLTITSLRGSSIHVWLRANERRSWQNGWREADYVLIDTVRPSEWPRPRNPVGGVTISRVATAATYPDHWSDAERRVALDSLAAARKRWTALKPRNYRYLEAWNYGINGTTYRGPEYILISGQRVVGATDRRDKLRTREPMTRDAKGPVGIDRLFAYIERETRDTTMGSVWAKYHPTLGYPVDVRFDTSILASDTEHWLRVPTLDSLSDAELRRERARIRRLPKRPCQFRGLC